ncbi:flagellar hook protein FlgE [Sulfurospirillum diekertiae]|uniref:Flagellar hook protein FlgE n=1 Tax=Sulfurospirillum diekertiae TaxID=1854492 RepID=A0A6G9VTP2_9BACT|nr:flagellar hook protein FlgE [Sulfurospirillum diekertiae]QIR76024.1 flagellar hook protein FlgE [Sulfurospirillum diekertiae]QIR78668.1 flagellar hook protein FlgE [Sulfurospirillum diekertiae]
MMRSLWAGVTGLQAHQIAMDVEGNNIANVNTTGYKYSRANFSDLLSQTAKIATAPQGELGGKNAMQIGLGTQVSTVTKIFKQGSIETTDKTTDLAIQGDGFFVVSPDGGSTYKYTRSGDFTFDANGNFVDTNGYIAQGWNRDKATLAIDSTSPIANITIPPGLTTPANASSYISVKANLDSGSSVGTHKSVIYSLDANSGWVDVNGNGIQEPSETHNENDVGSNMFDTSKALYERGQDFGALFNSDGNAFNLTKGQGVWTSFAEAITTTIPIAAPGSTVVDLVLNGETITGSTTSTDAATVASYVAGLINAKTGKTGVQANITGGTGLYLTNNNQTGTEAASKNIKLTVNSATDNTNLKSTTVITAYQYTYTPSPLNTTHSYDDGVERTFTTTEDLREALQKDARLYVNYKGTTVADGADILAASGTTLTGAKSYSVGTDFSGGFTLPSDITLPAGTIIDGTALGADTLASTLAGYPTIGAVSGVQLAKADVTLPIGTLFNGNVVDTNDTNVKNEWLTTAAQSANKNDGVTVKVNSTGQFEISNPTGDAFNADDGDITNMTPDPNNIKTDAALTTSIANQAVSLPASTILPAGTYTFVTATTINGTSYAAGSTATLAADTTLTEACTLPAGTTVTFTGATTDITLLPGTNYKSDNDFPLYLTITNLTNATNNVAANTNFSTTINALQGTLTSGTSVRTSQAVYAASHASSIDVYDSLGSKHTVRLEFTKTGFTSEGGTEWSVLISVPEPGDINLGNYPENIVTGTVSFNSDGSLATYSPRNLTYTANNGSTGNQNIELKFGTLGQFDGITSFDKDSNTSGISQDGYSGGDLNGLSVDETGTIIGSFTNGRSFALAQVAMATFTNNQGLESDGGNCFVQTSNSGDPIVGQAATGGKGTIQASSLEMSNVDLSRSLTQLIVIQRGYQANSKTITTADEMLNTLLQLK